MSKYAVISRVYSNGRLAGVTLMDVGTEDVLQYYKEIIGGKVTVRSLLGGLIWGPWKEETDPSILAAINKTVNEMRTL